MTGGMAKYWIIPRVGDKELPRVGHKLASCSLPISYVLTMHMITSKDVIRLCMSPSEVQAFVFILYVEMYCSSSPNYHPLPGAVCRKDRKS